MHASSSPGECHACDWCKASAVRTLACEVCFGHLIRRATTAAVSSSRGGMNRPAAVGPVGAAVKVVELDRRPVRPAGAMKLGGNRPPAGEHPEMGASRVTTKIIPARNVVEVRAGGNGPVVGGERVRRVGIQSGVAVRVAGVLCRRWRREVFVAR